MSIRTTITLEDDVLERVKQVSKTRASSFKDTVNEVLRLGLLKLDEKPHNRTLVIEAQPMGLKPGLSYDDVEELIEYGEGPLHR